MLRGERVREISLFCARNSDETTPRESNKYDSDDEENVYRK